MNLIHFDNLLGPVKRKLEVFYVGLLGRHQIESQVELIAKMRDVQEIAEIWVFVDFLASYGQVHSRVQAATDLQRVDGSTAVLNKSWMTSPVSVFMIQTKGLSPPKNARFSMFVEVKMLEIPRSSSFTFFH